MSSKTFSRAKVSVVKPAAARRVIDAKRAGKLAERIKGKTRLGKPIGTAICGVCGCYERTW